MALNRRSVAAQYLALTAASSQFPELVAAQLNMHRIVLAVLVTATLTACSKHASWEEEVPLNTGATIWVRRHVTYRLAGDAGNPFNIAWRPDKNKAIEFTWDGKDYRYFGDANPMLLAIAPQRHPVLVARATDNSWNLLHRYGCTVPFYVELVPDTTGAMWAWPPSIEPWLYDLPANLMARLPEATSTKNRYTAAERAALDAESNARWTYFRKVDPAYTGDDCGSRRS